VPIGSEKDPFIQALHHDTALEIDAVAKKLWLKDMENPLRWNVYPFLRATFAFLLNFVWFFKRLPLPQFSHHKLLQRLICWFCDHLVSHEANILILRHFATESNILNFLIDNSPQPGQIEPLSLYPLKVQDMMAMSFVKHDQELFRCLSSLDNKQVKTDDFSWKSWRSIEKMDFEVVRRKTQILDFETSHALFMCLFCFLLTAKEYRGAINGFNLDQSIALRIGNLLGRKDLSELAYNKFPLYLVGPWNLTERFIKHGFFTEHLYSVLESVRRKSLIE